MSDAADRLKAIIDQHPNTIIEIGTRSLREALAAAWEKGLQDGFAAGPRDAPLNPYEETP